MPLGVVLSLSTSGCFLLRSVSEALFDLPILESIEPTDVASPGLQQPKEIKKKMKIRESNTNGDLWSGL